MEFGPQDACKRRGLSITGGWEKSAIFLYSISSKMGEKNYSAAISHYWEGKKPPPNQKKPLHHTPKKPRRSEQDTPIQNVLKRLFSQRFSLFTGLSAGLSVTGKQEHLGGVMVNKSIFKCMILKQKNISLLC